MNDTSFTALTARKPTKDIEGILRFHARDGNVFDYSNDTVVVTRALLMDAADQIARMRTERLMLDKRIHNQRRACRETWEIVEMRRKWLGSGTARKAYGRLFKRYQALKKRGISMIGVQMAGRPLKPNVIRDKRGKSRGEALRIDPAVLAVRARHLIADGIAGAHASDALAGFTLGRLLLRYRNDKTDPSGISQEQYDSGDLWCKIVHRHAAVMGYKLRTKTPSFIMVSGGISCGDEPGEDEIIQIRRRFSDCYNMLADVCRVHGIRVRDVTYGVVIENWPMNALYERDYGDLKIGLNTLGRALR